MTSLIVTCEHAGYIVPEGYKSLFRGKDKILHSHRGWDIGAMKVAEKISQQLNVPLHTYEVTRLLIEPNRSLDHPQLFSEFTSELTQKRKEKIIHNMYLPFRNTVVNEMQALERPIFHISIHSFTPRWNGKERPVDIGILFDPNRKVEAKRGERLRRELSRTLPAYRIKLNEPYKGVDDGFPNTLRKFFPDGKYVGVEIEINQKIIGIPMIQAELTRCIRSVAVRFKHPL